MARTPTIAATGTTTRTVTLKPTLKRKLQAELRAYMELRQQAKVLEHAMAKHKDVVEQIRAETGESHLDFEGFKIARVATIQARLVKEKLLAQGVSMAQIEAATEHKPARAYTKISMPGEKGDEG